MVLDAERLWTGRKPGATQVRSMKGFVAVTDPGWYQHLAASPGPKDANFWRPSIRPQRLEPGTPFFFKLKAPEHAIAGFGYFASFSILPDWLAWEAFGEANGVNSLGALQTRLAKVQHGARIKADADARIGCCLIAEAVFFPRDGWIAPPADWKPRTVVGDGYDLRTGEGLRIWNECRARAADAARDEMVREATARYGTPALRAPRLGQGIFRVQVLDAYDRACAVTGEHSLPVVEAAHIRPFATGGPHAVSNGLALRSDLHRLFDRGYVTIDEAHRFVVGDRLRRDFSNGRSYYGMHGKPLAVPDHPALRPAAAALQWHRESCFLG